MSTYNEVKLYAIDIETVSQGKIANDFTDKTATVAKNIKDPEKIAARLITAKDDLRGKHGLSWWTGKIISISIVEVFGDYKEVFCGHDEADILNKTMAVIGQSKLIGKTSINFDFPFIIGRLMALNIEIPMCFKNRNSLYDVDNFFGFSAASGQRSKLDFYAHGLAIKMKPMHGSQIQGKYDEIMAMQMGGDNEGPIRIWKEIADYNLHDSEVVANMARRYYGDSM